MGDLVREVTVCRVCGKKDWLEVLSLGSMPLANNYLEPSASYDDEPRFPLEVIVCQSCWLVTLRHVVNPDVLYRHYVYISSDSKMIVRHMHQLVSLIVQRFNVPTGSLVVELGSNIGTQLEVFRDAGMSVVGVDPARNLSEVAKQKGIETLPEFFAAGLAKQIAGQYGRPRIILGRHVFAHIDDLDDVLDGVKVLLDETGVFAVEVPYLLDLIEANQFDTIYHEHLSYFSVTTLMRLFERHGLRVVDVERVTVHGGSIVVIVGLPGGIWAPRPSVAEIMDLERRVGICSDTYYLEFSRRVDRIRKTVRDLVGNLARAGNRIACYGAPAKGNTLLNACGLSQRELAYASDTTELKQGRVLPGTHVPIISPVHAKAHPPDYYLMLAWNYAKEILEKEKAYLGAGGKFIVPIPEPVVVVSDSIVDGQFVLPDRLEAGGNLLAMSQKGLVQFNEGEIQGVVFRPLVVHKDLRGSLAELFRTDELPPEFHPQMATMSWTEPGMVRGPHEHMGQSNLLIFPGSQRFQLILWDNRPNSLTYRHVTRRVVGGAQPVSVLLPAGIVHAYQNVSDSVALSMNLPNQLFKGERRQSTDEAVRHEQDESSPFQLPLA